MSATIAQDLQSIESITITFVRLSLGSPRRTLFVSLVGAKNSLENGIGMELEGIVNLGRL
jgi:hypothetical protein